MGSQESGGTLNSIYSAEEMLKASVSNEGRIDVLPWYRLVGAYVGLLSGASASGSKWLRVVRGCCLLYTSDAADE